MNEEDPGGDSGEQMDGDVSHSDSAAEPKGSRNKKGDGKRRLAKTIHEADSPPPTPNVPKQRKVAKTMLETDAGMIGNSQSSDPAHRDSQLEQECGSSANEMPIEQSAGTEPSEPESKSEPGFNPKPGPEGSKRKVAKTMMESDLPDVVGEPAVEPAPAAAAAAEGQRKVAKTMMEGDVPDVVGEPVVEPAPAAAAAAEGKRKVAKTMMEGDVPDVVGEPVVEPAPAAAAAAEGKRKVAKTMMESDVPDVVGEPVVEPAPAAAAAAEGKRKVAKTMLESDVPDVVGEPVVESAPAAPAAAEGKRKVAKTMLERDVPDFAATPIPEPVRGVIDFDPATAASTTPLAQPQEGFSAVSEPPIARARRTLTRDRKISKILTDVVKPQRYVAKTMIDHAFLNESFSKVIAKREAKVAEDLKENPPPPAKMVAADKFARACSSKWDDGDSKERLRQCQICQTFIYNFDGLDRAEAESLVFQRENKKKPTLYQRDDGKFMTSDCPEIARKHNNFVMVVIGLAALILCIGVALSSMPPAPPPPPRPSVTVSPESPHGGSTGSTAGPSAKDKPGSFHYQDGKVWTTPSVPSPVTSTVTHSQPTADPDSDGSFWQYANPAETQYTAAPHPQQNQTAAPIPDIPPPVLNQPVTPNSNANATTSTSTSTSDYVRNY